MLRTTTSTSIFACIADMCIEEENSIACSRFRSLVLSTLARWIPVGPSKHSPAVVLIVTYGGLKRCAPSLATVQHERTTHTRAHRQYQNLAVIDAHVRGVVHGNKRMYYGGRGTLRGRIHGGERVKLHRRKRMGAVRSLRHVHSCLSRRGKNKSRHSVTYLHLLFSARPRCSPPPLDLNR